MENLSCIIVAGGVGKRMNALIPKQFLILNEKPIIFRTIECFAHFNEIVVVIHNDYLDYWKKLCKEFNFNIHVKIVGGGPERFMSVKNGLEAIESKSGIVAIHDSVRPFVSQDLINRGIEKAQIVNAAIPAIVSTSSMRIIDKEGNSNHIDRNKIRIIQTPQFFNIKLLKDAYKQEYNPLFTDDASVVEHFGEKIFLFEGEEENIKITSIFDLEIAKTILSKTK